MKQLILPIAIFCLIALRFLYPGDVSFQFDEPMLQLLAASALREHRFPLTGLHSSVFPVPYGGFGTWAYMLTQAFSDNFLFSLFVHIALSTLSLFLLHDTLKKTCSKEAALWTLALAASSPILFFFSRHAWDNTFLIFHSSLILWLLGRLHKKNERIIFPTIALIAALSIQTHLMIVPLLLAALLASLWYLGKSGALREPWRLLTPLTGLLLFLLLSAPYLHDALREGMSRGNLPELLSRNRWEDFGYFKNLILEASSHLSISDMRPHMLSDQTGFLGFSGPLLSWLFTHEWWAWVLKGSAWAMALFTLLGLYREESGIRRFWCLNLLCVLVTYQYLHLFLYIHYMHHLWFFALIGVALTLDLLKGRLRQLYIALLILTVTVNSFYIGASLAYIREQKGLRTNAFGPVWSEQKRAFKELCERVKADKLKAPKVEFGWSVLLPPSFHYWLSALPECREIPLDWSQKGEKADYRFVHPGRGGSAALVLEKIGDFSTR